jgi:nuclear protein localization family protein 4
MLYLICLEAFINLDDEDVPMGESETKGSIVTPGSAVDEELEKMTGLIPRGRDSKFCRHPSNGMCDYCSPLEPYDANYLSENKIKHMSYHAYLKKVYAKSKNRSVPLLGEDDLRIKKNCPEHRPYPEAICTKCQPSAITLQPQAFRLVDHIEIEDPSIVDNFLAGWRKSGYQRFGYLYGKYLPYLKVPLGIKAVVCAIYEPPQDGSVDGIELLPPDEVQSKALDALTKELGLERIGMIYTDLIDDGTGTGKVVCKRHAESYFVSGLEAIFIAEQQIQYRNRTKYSTTGSFGSKFVTLIVSGDTEGNIGIQEYQVSNSCQAMVEADIIEGSTDPSLLRVKPTTNELYVPEVFYKFKNEYNVDVSQSAKPTFPVDYLLVTVRI